MTASEQERILLHAPSYLRNVIVIMVEMGLRPYRELLRMKQEHVDLANETVHVADSKTSGGIADMPMTGPAKQAFAAQLAEAKGAEYLLPSPRHSQRPYISNVRKAWKATLKRAGVEYFALYELRHTFATRLSAGGVADHFVAQALRQDDSAVFKRYSQAKFQMLREALARLERQANEHTVGFGTPISHCRTSGTVLEQFERYRPWLVHLSR
ncbi:MAG: tyrosine-type recombinase/integrase [Bryobacterales bacterium]|nr:tyrosine-type recombinase/integrase [Bryobacterales bacterium]